MEKWKYKIKRITKRYRKRFQKQKFAARLILPQI